MKKFNINSILRVTLAICISLFMLSIYMLSGIYARYTTKASAQDRARVASFVFSDNLQPQMSAELNLLGIKPGDAPRQFTVTVTNKDASNNVCEVGVRYYLKVESVHGTLPLVFSVTYDGHTQKGAPVKSNDQTMSAGNAAEHTYTVTVEWPEENNDYVYANMVDQVTVTVYAEQID